MRPRRAHGGFGANYYAMDGDWACFSCNWHNILQLCASLLPSEEGGGVVLSLWAECNRIWGVWG